MSQCRSCGAKVRWIEMDSTGKLAPIDNTPSENGNVFINQFNKGVVLTPLGKSEIESRFGKVDLYLNHFATCPDAKSHRKPTTKGQS